MPYLTVATLLVFSITYQPAVAQDTFRDVKWGASKAEVRAAEDSEFVGEQPEGLIYKDEVAGLTAMVAYYFPEGSNQFARAAYIFIEEHSSNNLYIDDFEQVQEALEGKYGEPSDGGKIWRNDLFKDDRSDWGTALAAGHMTMQQEWASDRRDTKIYHQLSGDNFDISHILQYQRPALDYLFDQAQERRNAEDL